jgi:hypothetical protein
MSVTAPYFTHTTMALTGTLYFSVFHPSSIPLNSFRTRTRSGQVREAAVEDRTTSIVLLSSHSPQTTGRYLQRHARCQLIYPACASPRYYYHNQPNALPRGVPWFIFDSTQLHPTIQYVHQSRLHSLVQHQDHLPLSPRRGYPSLPASPLHPHPPLPLSPSPRFPHPGRTTPADPRLPPLPPSVFPSRVSPSSSLYAGAWSLVESCILTKSGDLHPELVE